VVIGRERTQGSQVVKQADVVTLLALLPNVFPDTMAEANFRHYEPRCAHGSSLSAGMHALVAARATRRWHFASCTKPQLPTWSSTQIAPAAYELRDWGVSGRQLCSASRGWTSAAR
jgi:hypothetical protein